jgi:catechol 2,3-dioxygenase-like lactoylglutathione lyase family enzyme
MIDGAHVILYSTDADADRAALRDVLGLPHVDVGGGWLIFGLPPAEVAVHPTDGPPQHELYLMCDDVEATIVELAASGIEATDVDDQGWGLVTRITLPGGSELGLYQPRHERPPQA